MDSTTSELWLYTANDKIKFIYLRNVKIFEENVIMKLRNIVFTQIIFMHFLYRNVRVWPKILFYILVYVKQQKQTFGIRLVSCIIFRKLVVEQKAFLKCMLRSPSVFFFITFSINFRAFHFKIVSISVLLAFFLCVCIFVNYVFSHSE